MDLSAGEYLAEVIFLNILIKNCDVYAFGRALLVNDRFNICSDLTSVAEAFGLSISKIECALKGKTYLITDDLLNVLKQLNYEYEFGKEAQNKELTQTIKDIISKNTINKEVDQAVLDMVQNIKKNGKYTTTKTREITETTEDNILVGRHVGNWVSNENEIRDKLLELSKKAQNTIAKTNAQLRDGTSKLIYARARQMGYAVQEVKKGTQTQLVLVRYE